MAKSLCIAVDFDGTCVTHEFPSVGKDIGAKNVLKKLTDSGHHLILWTMRSDVEDPQSDDPNIKPLSGKHLSAALKWFSGHNIPLHGIQTNPSQSRWTSSPKAYANLYIDDAALGVPLKMDIKICDRPYVDWVKVEEWLYERKIIKN